MSATVTLTGKTGPALTMTAAVFTEVTNISIDTDKSMVQLQQGGVTIPPISVAAASTVTATKSGNTWTLVIS